MPTSRNFMRNRIDRRPQRREDSQRRVAEWQALTPAEQLTALDTYLGKGVGAVKQRARIAAKMTKAGKRVSKKEQPGD